VERYRATSGAGLGDVRVNRLLLAYHDISASDGLGEKLRERGLMARVATDSEIEAARTVPPQNTRAKLRGDFIAAAQDRRRDHTVDWVHLKLNDATQHTVLCKDPFASSDERVEALITA